MTDFDVFNGDADGLCALVQLRLVDPREAELVTGVKRDIQLLNRVEAGPGDRITALDISLDKNREGLEKALAAGAKVFYADHHFAGELPEHEGLDAHIDTQAGTCTSLIVHGLLTDSSPDWAIVGAFGDNMSAPALELAQQAGWSSEATELAAELGRLLNYNAYGARLEDLRYPPAQLFEALSPHARPHDFIREREDVFTSLKSGYDDDMSRALDVRPALEDARAAVLVLPAEGWARRVSGELGNRLAKQHPERAHAILTHLDEGGFVVSVRAPIADRRDADTLCRSFPTGGGRSAAAGINELPESEYDRFVSALQATYGA